MLLQKLSMCSYTYGSRTSQPPRLTPRITSLPQLKPPVAVERFTGEASATVAHSAETANLSIILIGLFRRDHLRGNTSAEDARDDASNAGAQRINRPAAGKWSLRY